MIRKFTENDRSVFTAMCMDFYSSNGVDHPIPLSYAEKTFDMILAGSQFCAAYLCERNGKTVGYALLAFTYSNEAGGEVVWIEELYTLPEARGNGVASELLDCIISAYRSVARFRLEVTDTNMDAERLYRRKGFVPLNYKQLEILKKH